MTIESLILALFSSLAVWSLFTNILNYLFIAALFVIEYGYRRLRFRDHAYVFPMRMARIIAGKYHGQAPDSMKSGGA